MISLARMKNCGIAEVSWLSGAQSPLDALLGLEKELKYGITWPPGGERKNFYFPFIVFTGVVLEGTSWLRNYGQQFADFLEQNGLGTITTTPGKLNWTGSVIQIWVWQPDYPAVWAFIQAEKSKPKEVVEVIP